ncbi:hypothetical protein SGLAU_08000 [Streptomyces glaucescens]|uniref:Uncharacterized protein n=1 Tax=Streptomyces glaucescens TaxID=1907 RepID=A0A089X1G5_STRGA|nr:hypothetical protein SGLAU_08000 [Streptomyces glaucescens]
MGVAEATPTRHDARPPAADPAPQRRGTVRVGPAGEETAGPRRVRRGRRRPDPPGAAPRQALPPGAGCPRQAGTSPGRVVPVRQARFPRQVVPFGRALPRGRLSPQAALPAAGMLPPHLLPAARPRSGRPAAPRGGRGYGSAAGFGAAGAQRSATTPAPGHRPHAGPSTRAPGHRPCARPPPPRRAHRPTQGHRPRTVAPHAGPPPPHGRGVRRRRRQLRPRATTAGRTATLPGEPGQAHARWRDLDGGRRSPCPPDRTRTPHRPA